MKVSYIGPKYTENITCIIKMYFIHMKSEYKLKHKWRNYMKGMEKLWKKKKKLCKYGIKSTWLIHIGYRTTDVNFWKLRCIMK